MPAHELGDWLACRLLPLPKGSVPAVPERLRPGSVLVPIVAVVREGFTLGASPDEVASIFEVPLAFVTDKVGQIRKTGTFAGVARDYYSIPFDAYDIWGATARILVDLGRRLWT